jgi:hypothetical protein
MTPNSETPPAPTTLLGTTGFALDIRQVTTQIDFACVSCGPQRELAG